MPLYSQINQFLRQQIEAGILSSETRLPASRELADQLGVSRMTVINAYAELEAEGLVFSHHGKGTFVAPLSANQTLTSTTKVPTQWPQWQQMLQTQASVPLNDPYETLLAQCDHPDLIRFDTGMGTTELFAIDDFRRSLQHVLRRDGAEALDYGDTKHGGYRPLCQTIAQIVSSQGIPTRPEQVLITSGSQQAIRVVANLLLRPGDTVLVEETTYEGAKDQFALLDARIVGVPMDDEGLLLEPLEHALRTTHPRLIYTIPTFHNPTGTSLSTRRRHELVALAQLYNVPILEDDFAGDLRYDGHTKPALKALDPDGTVIYVNTFSKALVPGLRIGFLVADGPVYEQLLIHKRTGDRASSELMQRALEAYISVGRYQTHLRRVCRTYRQRRDSMHQALQESMPAGVTWQRPAGGLFLWLTLPDSIEADQLLPAALNAGVSFVPGSAFYADERPSASLRLNFSVNPPDKIAAGMQRLSAVIKQAMDS